MGKRYIRIDIEYEHDSGNSMGSFHVTDNIKRILKEDMPYCKVIFTRDAPDESKLDDPRRR